MSIFIPYNLPFLAPSVTNVPSTSSSATHTEMVPDPNVPVMTDDECSIVDISAPTSVYSLPCKEIKTAYCYHIPPYSDHNYSAVPPPSPTPLHTLQSTGPLSKISVPDEDSTQSVESRVSDIEDDDDDGIEESVTRCICGYTHDDEYMICCDQCLVWQHIDCMGIDRGNIPETYLCDLCYPRKLDRLKAKQLQARKKDSLIRKAHIKKKWKYSNQNGDIAGPSTSSGQRNYDSTDSDEIGPKSSENRSRPRSKRRRKDGSHKHDSSKKKRNPKHVKDRADSKKRMKRAQNKESTSTADEEAQDAWEYISEWGDRKSELIPHNQYSAEIEHMSREMPSQGYEKKFVDQLQTKQCQVFNDGTKKFLMCRCDLPRNSPIIEWKGKFFLRSHFHDLHPLCNRKLNPFILFYSLNNTEICVDSSVYGNDARYVRRSCKPNADVRHMVFNGNLYLYLIATKVIFNEDEVTIPLIISKHDSLRDLQCACGSEDCIIKPKKRNGNYEVRNDRKRTRRSTASADDENSRSTPDIKPPEKPPLVEETKPIPKSKSESKIVDKSKSSVKHADKIKQEPKTEQSPSTSKDSETLVTEVKSAEKPKIEPKVPERSRPETRHHEKSKAEQKQSEKVKSETRHREKLRADVKKSDTSKPESKHAEKPAPEEKSKPEPKQLEKTKSEPKQQEKSRPETRQPEKSKQDSKHPERSKTETRQTEVSKQEQQEKTRSETRQADKRHEGKNSEKVKLRAKHPGKSDAKNVEKEKSEANQEKQKTPSKVPKEVKSPRYETKSPTPGQGSFDYSDLKGGSDQESDKSPDEKKMTREERKIMSYMRAFAQMEKDMKKRQQAQEKQKVLPATSKAEDVEKPEPGSSSTEEKEKPPTQRHRSTEEKVSSPPKSKKGKKRRSSGTTSRKRTRTNSGSSDVMSVEDVLNLKNSLLQPDPSHSSDSESRMLGCSTPVPTRTWNDGTLPKPEPVRNPKRSILLKEWYQLPKDDSLCTSPPVTLQTEMNGSALPLRYVRDRKTGLSTSYLRNSSVNSSPYKGSVDSPIKNGVISPSPLKTSMVSSSPISIGLNSSPLATPFVTKKKWLRMHTSTDSLDQGDTCTVMETITNGSMSPNGHVDIDGPIGMMVDEFQTRTPVKKRRFIRESLESSSSPHSPATNSIDDTESSTVSPTLNNDVHEFGLDQDSVERDELFPVPRFFDRSRKRGKFSSVCQISSNFSETINDIRAELKLCNGASHDYDEGDYVLNLKKTFPANAIYSKTKREQEMYLHPQINGRHESEIKFENEKKTAVRKPLEYVQYIPSSREVGFSRKNCADLPRFNTEYVSMNDIKLCLSEICARVVLQEADTGRVFSQEHVDVPHKVYPEQWERVSCFRYRRTVVEADPLSLFVSSVHKPPQSIDPVMNLRLSHPVPSREGPMPLDRKKDSEIIEEDKRRRLKEDSIGSRTKSPTIATEGSRIEPLQGAGSESVSVNIDESDNRVKNSELNIETPQSDTSSCSSVDRVLFDIVQIKNVDTIDQKLTETLKVSSPTREVEESGPGVLDICLKGLPIEDVSKVDVHECLEAPKISSSDEHEIKCTNSEVGFDDGTQHKTLESENLEASKPCGPLRGVEKDSQETCLETPESNHLEQVAVEVHPESLKVIEDNLKVSDNISTEELAINVIEDSKLSENNISQNDNVGHIILRLNPSRNKIDEIADESSKLPQSTEIGCAFDCHEFSVNCSISETPENRTDDTAVTENITVSLESLAIGTAADRDIAKSPSPGPFTDILESPGPFTEIPESPLPGPSKEKPKSPLPGPCKSSQPGPSNEIPKSPLPGPSKQIPKSPLPGSSKEIPTSPQPGPSKEIHKSPGPSTESIKSPEISKPIVPEMSLASRCLFHEAPTTPKEKKKVSLSEYRARMRTNTSTFSSAQAEAAKKASPFDTSSSLSFADTLSTSVSTLTPLPLLVERHLERNERRSLFSIPSLDINIPMLEKNIADSHLSNATISTTIAPPSPKDVPPPPPPPSSLQKKETVVLPEEEAPEIVRGDLTERLKREFGFDISDESEGQPIPVVDTSSSHLKPKTAKVRKAKPLSPPPPPPPRPMSSKTSSIIIGSGAFVHRNFAPPRPPQFLRQAPNSYMAHQYPPAMQHIRQIPIHTGLLPHPNINPNIVLGPSQQPPPHHANGPQNAQTAGYAACKQQPYGMYSHTGMY